MSQDIVVQNLDQLYALQNHLDGEVAYVVDEKKCYIWHPEDGWQKVVIDAKNLEFNLYDLNKNIVNQLEPLTQEQIAETIKAKINFDMKTNNHFMLLSNEYHYYTLFEKHPDAELSFVDSILDIIQDLGKVYSIDEVNDGIEFWIKPINCAEPIIFMLFPYDRGVVYYD